MKQVWIHAGLPKCGSSALQVFFAENISSLKTESIEYPELEDLGSAKSGRITSGNGALLARSLLPEKHEAFHKSEVNLFEAFIRCVEESNSDYILISSEFFAVVPLSEIERLKDRLDLVGAQLFFTFYVRRQDQFLMSTYMQRVKRHGYSGLPEEFVRDNYKNIHYLKYHGYSKLYENVLGKDFVKPRIYEMSKNNEKGIAGDFVQQILGYVPLWISSVKSINTSPSPKELKLMLTCNLYNPRMSFSDYLIEDSAQRGRSSEYGSHRLLSDEMLTELEDYFVEQNKNFFQSYFSDEIFEFPKKNDSTYIDLKDLNFSGEELMDVIAGFLVRYDKRLYQLENRS